MAAIHRSGCTMTTLTWKVELTMQRVVGVLMMLPMSGDANFTEMDAAETVDHKLYAKGNEYILLYLLQEY